MKYSTDACLTVIKEIEEQWYLVEQKTDLNKKFTKLLTDWLDKDNDCNSIILYSDCSFKNYVRSFRQAMQDLLNTKKAEYEEFEVSDLKELVEKKTFKNTLNIQIGDKGLEFTILLKPKAGKIGHIGNCVLEGIGRYSDIWPMLTLITDCNSTNNAKLAAKFLTFAKNPFSFLKEDLIEINPKFKKNEFQLMISTYCRYLTGIAFLYTFLEPARRIEASLIKGKIKVKPNVGAIHASSMVTILKCIKNNPDEEIGLNLNDAFAPNSDFIICTRKAANQTGKNLTISKQTNVTSQAISRFFSEAPFTAYEFDKPPTADEIKNIVLNPDSENEYSSEDEDGYTNIESEEAYKGINTNKISKCIIS